MKHYPPYEGNEPYLYFAFSGADERKAWELMRPLLKRGVRIWYAGGPAGSAEELLHRQERAAKAALTLLYLSDAAAADKDTKSLVLVNQDAGRPILCLDADPEDRRLAMGMHEDAKHFPLYKYKDAEDTEEDLVRSEGFTQDLIGEAVDIGNSNILGKLAVWFTVLAALLIVLSFAGYRYFGWFQPKTADGICFTDTIIESAAREAVGRSAITKEALDKIHILELNDLPESWDDLSLFPSLERIRIPQQALSDSAELPDGDIVIELSGGGI